MRARTLILGCLSAAVLLAAAPATGAGAPGQAFVAYEKAGATQTPEVWAAGPGGATPQMLGAGVGPLLAPDGRLVAAGSAASGSGPALLVYSVAGAPVAGYGSLTEASAQPLAWSPDSRYLAVAFQSNSVSDIAQGSTLAVIDLETGALTTIAHGISDGASFAVDGSDRLAYAVAPSLSPGAPVDIRIAAADGSSPVLLTHDGRSLNPVWGSRGIAYDRERLRAGYAPQYEIWLTSPAGRSRQLTRVPAGPLVSGLVPLAFSADGSRLLAEFEGQDTSAAWTVTVGSGRARALSAGRHSLQGAGISRGGGTVLLDEDSFERPPSAGRIVTMPFGGGRPHVLVAHGGEASWTG